jgi:hypothetical protein
MVSDPDDNPECLRGWVIRVHTLNRWVTPTTLDLPPELMLAHPEQVQAVWIR